MYEENKGNIIIYKLEDGTSKIDVKIENDTVWLTQKQMSELFSVAENNITYHIQNIIKTGELTLEATTQKIRVVQKEGNREVKRDIDFYNLDMIISIGYRVNSKIGIAFRQWATKHLAEYMVKGFVLDVNRLKHDKNTPIEELLEQIRDIRASEMQFYQKVREVLKLSSDYKAKEKETQLFFANIQNKLLFAVLGKTAAEIIYERADHKEINMGLTSFKGSVVRVCDIYISKNYLKKDEIIKLNRLTTMFLDYVENQVERTQKQLFMDDWENKTDKFLEFNEYNLLDGFGNISNKTMKNKANTEYKIFDKERKERQKIEADKEDLKELEKFEKKIKNK